MIAGLFRRRDPRREAITALHERLIAAARRPGLYTRLGVPDTLEGRFESLTLHAVLVLRALHRLPAPAGEVAQDLVNDVFGQLDASLRELGVGDMGVGKRMKKLAQAFYGRAESYAAALDAGGGAGDRDALAATLARNVAGDVVGYKTDERPAAPSASMRGLAGYVLACEAALREVSLDDLLASGPALPEPWGFAEPDR